MEQKKISTRPERLNPIVVHDVTFKSADDFSITEEDIEKARVELHETPSVRETSLIQLKEKINSDEKISYRTDDEYLLRYLRYTKFDIDKAFKVLRNFYVFRAKHPEVFSLSDLEGALRDGSFRYLPYTDHEKCIIYSCFMERWYVDKWNAWQVISEFHAVSDVISLNPNIQINGIKGIWNLKGLTLRHITRLFSPRMVIFLINAIQELYPWRIKKIFITHATPLFIKVFNAVLYFLKKKIRDRIVILGSDLSELQEHFDPAILPEEYGGTLEESQLDITQHIMENIEYLKYDRTFGPKS